MILAVIIFSLIFLLITMELFNKTVVALIGAVTFILLHFISQEEAFMEIDWNVIFLLISMMVIVGITKNTGLFQYVAIKAAKLAKGNPVVILISLSLITAVFSALLDNVTTVLILTPVSILIAVELGLTPIPFIISEAIFSNIGGTATLIGDPPNLMIGSAAGITFLDFLVYLGPVVGIILIFISLYFYIVFRKKLIVKNERKARIMEFDESKAITNKKMLFKSVAVLSATIAGFLLHGLLHLEPATVSIGGAAVLLLITGKHEIDEFFHEVEWGTIFFFVGLFILVGGLSELGVIKLLSEKLISITHNNMQNTSLIVIWASGICSGIIDNIPYVATMIPLVQNIGVKVGAAAVLPLWFSLSLGSCLGGNATLIGASANVVSAGLCSKSGYKITFLGFLKHGIPVTIISLAISTVYIYLIFYM
ncbi:MAG: ArsB/NhaD family transporter [Spirochaetes bacterium]|nr:ArsB/NhaD family transporter [Spirochaetota bacterium]